MRSQADAPAPAADATAAGDATEEAGAAGGDTAAPPHSGDAASRARRLAERKADLEALRALRESHTMKQLSELPLAVKHGWTTKEKLKDALRSRPRSVADSATRKAERLARGPLTEEMLTEIKRRMAAGESLGDVRQSDAFGGALRLFPLDLLRRRVSGNVVRTHQCRTAVAYKGLTLLKSGKFQVQYKKKYVGALHRAYCVRSCNAHDVALDSAAHI